MFWRKGKDTCCRNGFGGRFVGFPYTVYNFSTVRWLDKHHKKKKVVAKEVNDQTLMQLREMFDQLDDDNSGTIEVTELQVAMEALELEDQMETILEQFEYMDADNSGSIDFEEFVNVMTSSTKNSNDSREYFQLKDEMEARKWTLAFFLFSSTYRRQRSYRVYLIKIREMIWGGTHTFENSSQRPYSRRQ